MSINKKMRGLPYGWCVNPDLSITVMPLAERYARESYRDLQKRMPSLPDFDELPLYLREGFRRYGDSIVEAYEHFGIAHGDSFKMQHSDEFTD